MRFPDIVGQTLYTLTRDDGRVVVQASSRDAASGLFRSVRINPASYPLLRWQWKIAHVLKNGDVTKKTGDDCAARLYVAFAFDSATAGWWQRLWHKSARFFAGKELPGSALTYIWANRAPAGAVIPNAYAREAEMFVLQSGNRLSRQWVSEQRNLLDDYRRAFGRTPPEIIGIAIMTDTDNTREETTAWYGDIELTRAP